jgi:mannosyl-3-phosphoglycerate phosphatase
VTSGPTITPTNHTITVRGVLFTDLDGTLLDFVTYQPSSDAIAVVEEMAAARVLTVAVSSKTAAEVRHLAQSLRLAPIAVVEGGPVILGPGGATEVLGFRRPRLLEILHTLQRDGWPIRGFSQMTAEEIGELTGLDLRSAQRAMDREASEPFVLVSEPHGGTGDLERRAERLGAGITRGGRLWHLLAIGMNKGRGVFEALARIGPTDPAATGAVGDAWNDLPMFDRVDRGFLLGSAVGPCVLPGHVRRIPDLGPPGFVTAAREFLEFCRRRR